jgi:Flp pilus assembly protein TadG
MIRRTFPTTPPGRIAATVVEFALVAPLVFFLIIGCLEWCLYMMTINQAQNAVREGARYAVVRTDVYQSFAGARTYLDQNPPDTANAGLYSQQQVQADVADFINNQTSLQIANLQITVYKVNAFGQPIDVNGNVLTQSQAVAPGNQGQWNQTKFGDLIAVQLTATYKPIIPGISRIGLAPPVQATAVMGSEGN